MHALKNLPLFNLHTPARVYCGGTQAWYSYFWWRRAGCGPTTASSMAWYLMRSRDRLKRLWDIQDASQAEFISLMKEMFDYVTPGVRGVNTTEIFTSGVTRFAADRGVQISCRVLEVPEAFDERPKPQDVADFLIDAFDRDLPVAFLNLSNGKVQNLDNWHWVILVALEHVNMRATMLDQGNKIDIDLGLWLRTTLLGGGFVVIEG